MTRKKERKKKEKEKKKGAYKSITLITDNRNQDISYTDSEGVTNVATPSVNSALFYLLMTILCRFISKPRTNFYMFFLGGREFQIDDPENAYNLYRSTWLKTQTNQPTNQTTDRPTDRPTD